MLSGTNITFVTGGNSTAGSIGISAAAAGGGGAAVGMGATGNTAGNTFSSTTGTVYFQGTNNITVSGSTAAGSLNTIWISGPTGGGAGMGTGTNTSGTSGTVGKQLYFYGNSNVTLSQSVDGSSASLTFLAGGGGGGIAAGVSNTGNTAGDLFTASTGTVYVQASGGATLSGSTAAGSVRTLWLQAPASSAYAANVSNVSSAGTKTANFALADHAHIGLAGVNFSGTASTYVGNLMVSAGNNMTMSTGGNSSAGSIAFHNLLSSSSYAANVSNVSSAGTKSSNFALVDHAHIGVGGVVASGIASTFVGNVILSGGNNITLSTGGNSSAGSIAIHGPVATGTASQWIPAGIGYSSFTQMGQSSLVLFQANAPAYLSASAANLYASISVSTSSNSSHDGRISMLVGIYTKNASTLSLASSGSTYHSWNVTGTTSSGSMSGWRAISVPININMTPGDYWIGVISITSTTNANWFTASNMGLIAVPAAFVGPFGATNNTLQWRLGEGVWSAQSASIPDSVAFSHITATSASTARPVIQFYNQTV